MGLLKYKKVYVLAPYKVATGGVELAHQLVDCLRDNGKEAYIVYVSDGGIVGDNVAVTREYGKYNIAVSAAVDDDSRNVLVMPEIYLSLIPKFSNIQECVWWMSVDSAYSCNKNFADSFAHCSTIRERLWMLRHFRSYTNLFSMKQLRRYDSRLTHFYQSAYIQHFLYSLGLERVVRLTDYINADIMASVDPSAVKRNVILYNPVKGMRYTKRLMASMPGYDFVALQGLSREQLGGVLDSAKVYVDFGPFPGKDRLPREAVMHNCCIVTGRFGSSGFFEDVPIGSRYKFDMRHADYGAISDCIADIFANYGERLRDFDYMRSAVMRERDDFYTEVDKIFF